jgi:hypothetical protein
MHCASTFARSSAVFGVVVWLLLLPTTTSDSRETELVHKVVFFAMLVIVPLALSLIPQAANEGSLHRLAVLLQPVAAVPAIASFFLQIGWLASLLASAWFALTLLIALLGLTRFMARGLYPLPESSIDAGLLYLPVAGGWLVIYRLGVQPLGYGEMIILLTVAHFHFAAYAGLIISGLNGRALALRDYPKKAYAAVVLALVASMPIVAAGITFSPWLGLFGTLLISVGLVGLAVLTVGWVIPSLNGFGRRLLLLIAAASNCAAMVLACLYAYSLPTHTLIIDIPTMAMTHGLLNAFGFVTCSLLAWSLNRPQTHKHKNAFSK